MKVTVRLLRKGGHSLHMNEWGSGPSFAADPSVCEELDRELGRLVLRATGPPTSCKAPAGRVATRLASIRSHGLGSQPTSVRAQSLRK